MLTWRHPRFLPAPFFPLDLHKFLSRQKFKTYRALHVNLRIVNFSFEKMVLGGLG